MVDIQSATAEIRRGKKRRKIEETTGKNIMACPIPYGGHNKYGGRTAWHSAVYVKTVLLCTVSPRRSDTTLQPRQCEC